MIATHMEFMATLSRNRSQVIAQDLEPHPWLISNKGT